MKLHTFLEKKGEQAHRQAVALGLQYKGFGYWVDPSSGEVTHKTENDQLVPVTPDVESDMFKGDKEGAAMAPPGGPGRMAMPGVAAAGAMGMQRPSGLNVGPAVDQARAPAEKKGWDAGPDGDTCVGGQPREELPSDTFVGKTNYMRWTAGMDGSNAIELGGLKAAVREAYEGEINPDRKQHAKNMMRAVRKGVQSGDGIETQRDAAIKGRKTGILHSIMRRAGVTDPAQHDPKAVNPNTSIKQPTDSTDTFDFTPTPTDSYDTPKTPDWVGDGVTDVRERDKAVAAEMTKDVAQYVTDPTFDLDQYDDRAPVNVESAFGKFIIGDNGVGVKSGMIGPEELKALHAMQDNPQFPTLINARFESPFINQAAGYNNPGDDSAEGRGPDGQYFDPESQTRFSKKYPGAKGKYAMTVAKGESIFDALDSMPPDLQRKAMMSFWRARGALHQAGFAHNDMHGGNIYVDPETGETSIIDLGLAKDGPVDALMEALGGFNPTHKVDGDKQLSPELGGAAVPKRLRARMDERVDNLEQAFMDKFSETNDDPESEEHDNAMQALKFLRQGGFRMPRAIRESLTEVLPMLQDREFVMGAINKLYEGLTDFDEEQQDTINPIKDIIRQKNAAVPTKDRVPTSGLTSRLAKLLDFDD